MIPSNLRHRLFSSVNSNENTQTGDYDNSKHKNQTNKLLYDLIYMCLSVSICMSAVSVCATVLKEDPQFAFNQSAEFNISIDSSGPKVIMAGLAMLVLAVAFLVAVTLIILELYKRKYYTVLYCWVIGTCISMLFVRFYIFLADISFTLDVQFSEIAKIFVTWNFGVMGIIALLWKAPLYVQQGYLLAISSLLSVMLLRVFPGWYPWGLLILLCIWDVVAVNSDWGPLRRLIQLAHDRNETYVPALVYTLEPKGGQTGVFDNIHLRVPFSSDPKEKSDTETDSSISSSETPSDAESNSAVSCSGDSSYSVERKAVTNNYPSANRAKMITTSSDEDEGMRLGLGDFIFYSMMVGKAAMDGTTVFAALAVALTANCGMFATLVLLPHKNIAVPALPLSVISGMVCYFGVEICAVPFGTLMAKSATFI